MKKVILFVILLVFLLTFLLGSRREGLLSTQTGNVIAMLDAANASATQPSVQNYLDLISLGDMQKCSMYRLTAMAISSLASTNEAKKYTVTDVNTWVTTNKVDKSGLDTFMTKNAALEIPFVIATLSLNGADRKFINPLLPAGKTINKSNVNITTYVDLEDNTLRDTSKKKNKNKK